MKRRIVKMFMLEGEVDKSGHVTLLPSCTRMCSNDSINIDDEFKDDKADRSGHATPLPPHPHSKYDVFNSVTNFSQHPIF
jgi:hypothetical protein